MSSLIHEFNDAVNRVPPLVWFFIGGILLFISVDSADALLWTNPDAQPTVTGIVLSLALWALVVTNTNRPRSPRCGLLLAVLCLTLATHGAWWPLLWNGAGAWLESRMLELIPRSSYLRLLPIGGKPAILGGLTIASVLLTWPMWVLTRSRLMRTTTLLAGPVSFWIFLSAEDIRPFRCRVAHTQLVMEQLANPAMAWYVLVFLPLAIIAQRSHCSPIVFVGDCLGCGYPMHDIQKNAPCPECGWRRAEKSGQAAAE